MEWTRPEHVPYPSIWSTFEGKQHRDSPPLLYTIQDLTEEMIEPAVEHMTTYFLVKENITSSIGYVEDKLSLAELRELWRSILKQRVGLVALVEDPEKEGQKRIAGINMTTIMDTSVEKEQKYKFQGEKMKKIFRFLSELEFGVDIPGTYGTTVYMSALGLSVAPQYQGDNVGYQLLMARTPLCNAIGVTLTVTAFTGATSQYLAKKAGFETISTIDYVEYKLDGRVGFPRLNELCLLMAKRIEPASK